MSLLNAIVAIPLLLMDKRDALSSKGFVFMFLLANFLTMVLPNKENKKASKAPASSLDSEELELFG
jgi:hypothetical protein